MKRNGKENVRKARENGEKKGGKMGPYNQFFQVQLSPSLLTTAVFK